MATPLFRPIPVKYTGLYSDDHLIDLQEFGVSLQGLAKLSNSVVDFYLHGRITKDSRLYQVRLFAAPPEPGCVILDIVALLATGSLPLYAPLLCELASNYIIPFFKAIIAKRLKRPDAMEKALDVIVALSNSHSEFEKIVHEGHMRDKAWLQGQVEILAQRNNTSLREIVRPIGSTARRLEIGKLGDDAQASIGEPEAQVLSAREELSVEDAREYRGTFEGVDTTNGTCKFRPVGSDNDIPGKITDPALLMPQNVYTHSLDTKQPVTVQAKAVTKDSGIVRLFISDGKHT